MVGQSKPFSLIGQTISHYRIVERGLWANVRREFALCVDAMPLFCVMLWDTRWSNAGVEAHAPKIFVGHPGEVC